MIEKIKSVAKQAQDKINAKISQNPQFDQNHLIHQVSKLFSDYIDLIEIAEEQKATLGLLLLSHQLLREDKTLTALDLATHYLNVLKEKQHSTYHFLKFNSTHPFRSDQSPLSISSWDDLYKLFVNVSFAVIFTINVIIITATVILGGIPNMLGIIPLLMISFSFAVVHITEAHTYSIGIFYHGMALLEFAMSLIALALGATFLLGSLIVALELAAGFSMPLLSVIIIDTLASGLCGILLGYGLWQHSNILEKKYEVITNKVIDSDTYKRNIESLQNFFKSSQNNEIDSLQKELSAITYPVTITCKNG